MVKDITFLPISKVRVSRRDFTFGLDPLGKGI